jgi:pyrroloquinoline quinone (PQQ) biosynthesis protein C
MALRAGVLPDMSPLAPSSLPLWHPDMMPAMHSYDGSVVIELPTERLCFSGPSAPLVLAVARRADGAHTATQVAVEAGCTEEAVLSHLSFLQNEAVVLDLADYRSGWPTDEALVKLRAAARFYNLRVAANPALQELFSGQASREVFLGFAIEFYFYVRSATTYMAQGTARFDHDAATMAPYWRHFREEAKHHEIFREGLLATGMTAARLRPNCAIATTQALINFLFERASRTLVEYGSLFALMQPPKKAEPAARAEKYERLRRSYPFADKFIHALEHHETIDAEAGHQTWALEQHLRCFAWVSAEDMWRAYMTMRDAACFFAMFFDGIKNSYQIGTLSVWKQLANVTVEAGLM